MPALEMVRPRDTVARLADRFTAQSADARLRTAIVDVFPGTVALVTSFGADSVVLLHMVAAVDTTTPVIFIDTGHHFTDTLAYRDRLVARLGLTNVSTHSPTASDLAGRDPEAFLWARDPDLCCHIRKVLPLSRALEGYSAWISGRKRFQASSRQSLPFVESVGSRIKINPLADWSARDILAYMGAHGLPRHELVARNYLSVGCVPCTSPVRPGEDARAGRWRGTAKRECGIHIVAADADRGL